MWFLIQIGIKVTQVIKSGPWSHHPAHVAQIDSGSANLWKLKSQICNIVVVKCNLVSFKILTHWDIFRYQTPRIDFAILILWIFSSHYHWYSSPCIHDSIVWTRMLTRGMWQKPNIIRQVMTTVSFMDNKTRAHRQIINASHTRGTTMSSWQEAWPSHQRQKIGKKKNLCEANNVTNDCKHRLLM